MFPLPGFINYDKKYIVSDKKIFFELSLVEGRARFTMGDYDVFEGKMQATSTAFIPLTDSDRIDMSEFLESYQSTEGLNMPCEGVIKFKHIQDKRIEVELTIDVVEGYIQILLFQNEKNIKDYKISFSDVDMRTQFYSSSWSDEFNYGVKEKIIRSFHDFFVTNFQTYMLAHIMVEIHKATK